MLAGGLGRSLARLFLVLIVLFFFYRNGTRIIHELTHVMARFIGQRNDYLAAAATTIRAVVYGILLTALVQGVVAGGAIG